MVRKLFVLLMVSVASVSLTACASWEGATADKIDSAVASVDFGSVGKVVCDYKRPGQPFGGSTLRFIGIEGSDNGQALVDALLDAGFTTDGLSDDFTDGELDLFVDGVDFFVQVEQADQSYAFGNCITPDAGAVTITISA